MKALPVKLCKVYSGEMTMVLLRPKPVALTKKRSEMAGKLSVTITKKWVVTATKVIIVRMHKVVAC